MNSSKKRITIKDIASMLDLHHSTVSRALSNHPDIQPSTKKRVLDMVEKLNYYPNLFARNLKTNSNNIIGVIVPEIRHSFFSEVISGIEKIAYKEGYALLLSQSNEDFEREVINTQALVSNRVAGLLVSISQTTKDDSHFRLLEKYGINLVFFDRVMENFNASKVVVDDYEGAFEAINYLIKKGYKRIAHLGGSKDLVIAKKRFEGYRDALLNSNISYDSDLVFFGGFQEKNGYDGMQYLFELPEKPDAVFAVNDPVAIGAYSVIKDKGFKIPDDVAVVGFSNNPISALVDPALTTVEQPAFEIGEQAALILFEQIKNKTFDPVTKILKTRLIVRNSA